MISAIIITKNEERNIEKCLQSVRWCDEIIIIDDKSSDRTIEIAKKYKATVYSRALNNNFSDQRNFGVSKAKNEWILFIDGDEIISVALTYEIQSAISVKDQDLTDFSGFYLRRSDFIWGKTLKYGEAGNMKLLRLFKKNSGKWEGAVHEKWKISGKVGLLKNPIIHFPHQSISEFLSEINFYTTIRAQYLYSRKLKTNALLIALYPSSKFIFNYFLKKGFLDGIYGLIYALLMSFHSFLVRGKLWLLWNRK